CRRRGRRILRPEAVDIITPSRARRMLIGIPSSYVDTPAMEAHTVVVGAFHWGVAIGTVVGAGVAVDQYCGGGAASSQCSNVLSDPKAYGEAGGFAGAGGVLFFVAEVVIHHFKNHG